jgi:hypothetical protein
MTQQEIIELVTELNASDEHPRLEAKSGVGDSLYETICALANEPGLAGGRILVGVRRAEDDFFSSYELTDVADPDKASADIASACATMFNLPISRAEPGVGSAPRTSAAMRMISPSSTRIGSANPTMPAPSPAQA